MRTWLALPFVLAACGGPKAPAPPPHAPPPVEPAAPEPAAPEAPVDTLGIDWATVPHATDEEALAIWAQLGLTGDNWEVRLGEIPYDAEDVRDAMAKALLREGNFACPAASAPVCDGRPYLQFREIAPTADLTDPCLRRGLAVWALDELDSEVANTELAADMITLAGLPPPEDELNRYALQKVSDETLRLQMLDAAERAGNETVADENLGNLTMSQIMDAATRLHVDGAVEVLDVFESFDVYAQVAVDDGFRLETRTRAIGQIGEYAHSFMPGDPERDRALEALEAASRDPDCQVAATALMWRDELDGRASPSLPAKSAKAPAILRTMCVFLLGQRDTRPLWKAVTAPKGIVLRATYDEPELVPTPEDDPDFDPDADTAPLEWAEVQRIPRESLDDLMSDGDFLRALPHCNENVCTAPGTGVTFTFTFKKGGGRLLLDSIERHEAARRC